MATRCHHPSWGLSKKPNSKTETISKYQSFSFSLSNLAELDNLKQCLPFQRWYPPWYTGSVHFFIKKLIGPDNELYFTKIDCTVSQSVITLKHVQYVIFYTVIKMITKN